MIKFSHLVVIALVLIEEIACLDSLQAVLPSYYDSGIQQQFKKDWQKYQHAFENAVVSGLQENFGSSAVNIYVAERHDSQLLARGFHLSDGVVDVFFHQIVLRELPTLVRPKLNIELPSNHLKFESKVGRMFVEAQYYVARNKSSVIYAHPDDQKALSPFSLQQVDNLGKVAIVAEDCTISGISIVTLNGESLHLGHTPIQLSDCKFTVEISTPNSGAPPVIAPYFSKGPKETLEMILGKPLVEELKTKLQGAMYSFINTTVLFGDQVAKFRDNQHKLFTSYADFIKNYVSSLNQKTLQVNKGQVALDDYDVYMDAVSEKRQHPCRLALTGLVLYGLETAYVSRIGGPYNDGAPETTADAIVFSSMQIRGKVTHDDNGTTTSDFAAEITDITVNIVINIGKGDAKIQDISLAGWRSLEFSVIPWETHYEERIGYEALVYGHILNVLPTKIISHLKGVLEGIPFDDGKQDSGGGADDDISEDKEDRTTDSGNKNQTDGNDNNDSSSSESSHTNGSDVDDNKNKEFFTDDLLDKDFFTDDTLDKNFFSDDKIKKDFFTDESIKENDSPDDKAGVSNDDLEQADTQSEEHIEDNEDSGDGVDEGVSDSNDGGNANGEGAENINADDESVSGSADDEAKADKNNGTSDGGADVVGDSDDSKVGVDDDAADVDSGGIASDGNRSKINDFFTDDNIEKDFFTDDNIKEGFMSEDKADGNKVDNKETGSDSSVSVIADSDNAGNMSSDGSGQVDLSNDDGAQVDGADDDLSEDDRGQTETNDDGTEKLPSGKDNFFTDDNIEKDFFTDDIIDKNFFNDDKEPAKDDDSSDKNEPNDQNDEDLENETSNVENDETKKIVDDSNESLSDDLSENNNNKNNAKKDFFTDDNLEKDFFTDDILEKDFFTDDNIGKDFLTDKNIKEDLISDDKVSGIEENEESSDDKDDAISSNSDNLSDAYTIDTKKDDASSSNQEDASVDPVESKVSLLDDDNTKDKYKLKENENKKIFTKNKPFLDENFFSDDNLDKGFMADGMRRSVGKYNDTANIRIQKKADLNKDDHNNDDIIQEKTGTTNVTNKNTNIENLDISKENTNENIDSQVKRNVLPLNVHNARRFDNLHMSENEIH